MMANNEKKGRRYTRGRKSQGEKNGGTRLLILIITGKL